MRLASAPTASTLRVRAFTATTDGSLSTIPSPRTHTTVLAVPRSKAMSRPMTHPNPECMVPVLIVMPPSTRGGYNAPMGSGRPPQGRLDDRGRWRAPGSHRFSPLLGIPPNRGDIVYGDTLMSHTPRKYDPEFKAGAVRIVGETRRPVVEFARDLGIGATGPRRRPSGAELNKGSQGNTPPTRSRRPAPSSRSPNRRDASGSSQRSYRWTLFGPMPTTVPSPGPRCPHSSHAP